MSARLLSGREASDATLIELASVVEALPFCPGLVFVRVGDDPASASYVRSKSRLAARVGIRSEIVELVACTSQEELLGIVGSLNADPDVDGILIQLPLPDHLDSAKILEAVEPTKDVDGFHPINVGKLWSGEPGLVPATPLGLVRILDHFQIPVEGRHTVIVGRSNLVGKPAAALFLRKHATVTLAHSLTRDLPSLTRQADILVVAVGRAGMITSKWVKPDAVVLDVGQSRVGGCLYGDVSPSVAGIVAALTPTPGGTGPMTVAMVIHNTIEAARARRIGGE